MHPVLEISEWRGQRSIYFGTLPVKYWPEYITLKLTPVTYGRALSVLSEMCKRLSVSQPSLTFSDKHLKTRMGLWSSRKGIILQLRGQSLGTLLHEIAHHACAELHPGEAGHHSTLWGDTLGRVLTLYKSIDWSAIPDATVSAPRLVQVRRAADKSVREMF